MTKLIISKRGRSYGLLAPDIEIHNHKAFDKYNVFNLVIEKTDLIDIDSSDSILIKCRKGTGIDSKSKVISTYIDFEDDETKDLFLFKLKRHLARNSDKYKTKKLGNHSRELISEINQDLNILRHKSKVIKKETIR